MAPGDAAFNREAVDRLAERLSDPTGIRSARREAFERYLELPLEPDPLYRQYGYFADVDLDAIDPNAHGPGLSLPPPGPRTIQVIHDASGTRVRQGRGLPEGDGVRFTPLGEIWAGPEDRLRSFTGLRGPYEDKLSALAGATLNRGYRLEIDGPQRESVRVQDVAVLSRPHEALAIRRAVRLGKEVRLTVSEETYSAAPASTDQRLLASSTSVEVGEGAEATVLSLHAPDPLAIGIWHRHASVGPRARLTWIWSGFGGFRTKVRNQTALVGQGSAVDDLQTFYGDGDQSYDSGIRLTHQGTDTHGQSITRGLFRDRARGMSRGLVRIEPEARKTLSYLSEHAMLLSKGARSDTIPILEILCRDVKATHSSSVAPVDPERVFYLESRGLPQQEAVRMIGEGFLSHVLERAPVPGLRETLYPYLAARWEQRPIAWDPDRPQLLPELAATVEGPESDWRFDAKLR